jgi:hypothetical protein
MLAQKYSVETGQCLRIPFLQSEKGAATFRVYFLSFLWTKQGMEFLIKWLVLII